MQNEKQVLFTPLHVSTVRPIIQCVSSHPRQQHSLCMALFPLTRGCISPTMELMWGQESHNTLLSPGKCKQVTFPLSAPGISFVRWNNDTFSVEVSYREKAYSPWDPDWFHRNTTEMYQMLLTQAPAIHIRLTRMISSDHTGFVTIFVYLMFYLKQKICSGDNKFSDTCVLGCLGVIILPSTVRGNFYVHSKNWNNLHTHWKGPGETGKPHVL